MIYRCTQEECPCIVEQEERPECCPDCGHTMEPAEEAQLSGREWALLGSYWIEGPARDEARALACFRHSAGMGEACGISNLGWCMENGVGIQADPRQAAWLYEQAALLDYVPAMCNFGFCLQQGIGVGPDIVRAAEWYRRAAEAGVGVYPLSSYYLAPGTRSALPTLVMGYARMRGEDMAPAFSLLRKAWALDRP